MSWQAEELIKLSLPSRNNLKCKVISVSSGKGGVGKTTFCINFSYVLSNVFSKRVLLIDADICLGNIHFMLGLEHSKNLRDLINGENVKNLIQESHGFHVLTGFSGIDRIDDLEDFNVSTILEQLSRISSMYDYIIIDTSAGITGRLLNFLKNSDVSYIITTPEPTALMDAYALMKSLKSIYGYREFKVVVNMCTTPKEAHRSFEKLKHACLKFLKINIKFAGYIMTSNELKNLIMKGKTDKDLSIGTYTRSIIEIAAREIGKEQKNSKVNLWNLTSRLQDRGANV